MIKVNPQRDPKARADANGGLDPGSITALQAGIDREHHFKKIFRRYHGAILSFFVKRGFPRAESHDLAQETFLRLHQGIASFRHDGYFEGWIFQIATNIYRNAIRDRKAIKRQAQEESFDQFLDEVSQVGEDRKVMGSSESPGPLDLYLEKERHSALARALLELPEQMRKCVILRIHHDLKYREIAAIMRISIETVKAHLYQARRRLKDELTDYFDRFDP